MATNIMVTHDLRTETLSHSPVPFTIHNATTVVILVCSILGDRIDFIDPAMGKVL